MQNLALKAVVTSIMFVCSEFKMCRHKQDSVASKLQADHGLICNVDM